MFTKSEKEEEFHHQFIEVVQRDYQGDSTYSLLTGLDYLLQKMLECNSIKFKLLVC